MKCCPSVRIEARNSSNTRRLDCVRSFTLVGCCRVLLNCAATAIRVVNVPFGCGYIYYPEE